jgi:dihydroorotase
MMNTILFKNARIVDPSQNMDEQGSVIVSNGVVQAIGANAHNQGIPEGATVINCNGNLIVPGLVDTRVFIGEPGFEYRETITSASLAAAKGGVTSIVMMPDTNPAIDSVAMVEFVRRSAREGACVHVYPSAAITKGLQGHDLTEMGLLRKAGAVAFTDGRNTIANSQTMRRALTYARDFDSIVCAELNDAYLGATGVMNEGLVASWLGLPALPKEAELLPLNRDLVLALLTKSKYHAAKISTQASVLAIKQAKDQHGTVSAGVAIHNLSLNENDIGEYQTFFKLSPPLRSEDDRQAMIEALRNGTIDVIVSSHDPQDVDTKRLPFQEAAFGAIGLETVLSAALRLYHDGSVPLMRLIDALSTKPAALYGLNAGSLKIGKPADLTLIDLDAPWVVSEKTLTSRSKNTCFEGAKFQGLVLQTMVHGATVYKNEDDTQ